METKLFFGGGFFLLFFFSAMPPLDEITMERVMEEFERCCHENMTHAMETEEGLGIEYDEDVVCDVCQSPDGEDNNEMVFCDKCNICVHQVRRQQHAGLFKLLDWKF